MLTISTLYLIWLFPRENQTVIVISRFVLFIICIYIKFRTIKKSNKAESLFKTGNHREATKWGLFLRITKLVLGLIFLNLLQSFRMFSESESPTIIEIGFLIEL